MESIYFPIINVGKLEMQITDFERTEKLKQILMKTAQGLKVLWTLDETADQLSVSRRTIERMVAKDELPWIRVGRSIRISAIDTIELVEKNVLIADNDFRARRDVPNKNRGIRTCQSVTKTVYSNEMTRNTGGSVTLTGTAKELAEVLGLPIERKQKHS